MKIFAVYDAEPSYAERFADFANLKGTIPFQVMAFTSFDILKEYSRENQIALLLISETVNLEQAEQIHAEQIMVLSGGEMVLEKDPYPSVYKYQSVDNVLREVVAYCCEQPVEKMHMVNETNSRILTVYSPVNRCLKTSFSLILGQLLARDGKVLYLNLEEFSGLSELSGTQYDRDLSDVLYYYQQGNDNWLRLSSMVYTWGNLDYIPPVRYPEDLCQISGDMLAQFVHRISHQGNYEILIVDAGSMGRQILPLLDMSDTIYMPIKEDMISTAKLEAFMECLKLSGREELEQRICRMKLPFHNTFGRNDTYLEQLLWGELGDYVRQLLKGRPISWKQE